MVVHSAVWLLVIVIIVLLLYLYYGFYSQVKRYPPGPPVLPVFGNALSLIPHLNRHLSFGVNSMTNTCDGIYTFWFFSKPIVIISSVDLAREAFNQTECSDRCDPNMQTALLSHFMCGHKTFAMMNYTKEYKFLRKLAVEAIRNVLSTQYISQITHKVVDDTVDMMIERESGNDFVPNKYIDNMFIRVTLKITFSNQINFDDSEIELISKFFESSQKELITVLIASIFPIIKLVFKTFESKSVSSSVIKMITERYFNAKHRIHDESESNNSLCDHHIVSLKQLKDKTDISAQYLNDSNIIGNLMTLMLTGGDTNHFTFEWLLLFLAYYTDWQRILREEINTKIGTKIPEIGDKDECHFVNAFICETLRFRNIFPFGLSQTSSSDTKIGKILIPKGTMIAINQLSILNDSRYWNNPDIFNPKRFLDSKNEFLSSKWPAFIPFGVGKRICVGDKLAITMLFLILTRLIQATNGFQICLSDKQNCDFEPKSREFFLVPKTYKVFLKPD